MASESLKKDEEFASSGGGPKEAEASAGRSTAGTEPNKMENELEEKKESKKSLDSAEDVAGRKEEGTRTKTLEKLTGNPSEKKREDPSEKGSKWL